MICGLEWARGKWPAPQGDIEVSWNVAGEKGRQTFHIEVVLPDGVAGSLLLPAEAERTESVTQDGQLVDRIPEEGVVFSGRTVVEQVFSP